MRFIPALLLIACACNVHAQTDDGQPLTPGYKYAVKAYASGLFSTYNYDGYNWHALAESHDYIHPSAAVMIRTQRGNFHEFEISNVDFRHTDVSERFKDPAGGYYYRPVYKLSSTRIAFRYEYIITLVKRNNVRLVPTLGWAAMPYFERFAQIPYITSNVPVTTATLGIKSFIVPRLQVNISKRVFLDMNVPICLLDMGTTRQNIADPSIPARNQRYNLVDLQFVPRYFSARIGVGVKI